MKTVSVMPADTGWMVRSEEIANDLFFRSGGAAERYARRIAEAIAEAGEAARLEIRLKDGSPVAKFLYPPKALFRPSPAVGGDWQPEPAA